jgi:hypothetical protein
MIKPKLDSNIVISGTRKATQNEIDNAMLLLTGVGNPVKSPSEIEVSIPAMDKALDIFCNGIRELNTKKTGLVKAFAVAFEVSFGKEWYTLEKQGKLGLGVRTYHKKVTAFYKSIGVANTDQKWARIKEASGYRTDGQIRAEAEKVEQEVAAKIELQKSSDQKICDYLKSIINLINKADITLKATPFLGQFQSAFYSIGGKMFK